MTVTAVVVGEACQQQNPEPPYGLQHPDSGQVMPSENRQLALEFG
jgi:hypothetical protein